jgi:hypothetical protein
VVADLVPYEEQSLYIDDRANGHDYLQSQENSMGRIAIEVFGTMNRQHCSIELGGGDTVNVLLVGPESRY